MKTMQEEWREYRDAIYPDGVSDVQNMECYQAFFAAAMVTIQKLDEIFSLPKDQVSVALLTLRIEIIDACEAKAKGKP